MIQAINSENFSVARKISKNNFVGKSYDKIFDEVREEDYKKYLSEKFGGRISIENIAKDQKTLEKIGGRMGGRDVIIAPNIFEKMMSDKSTANFYESKIKNIFDSVPMYEKQFATRSLNFESCGVIIHEDGTVTHICGCEDSPEKVAEVNRINAEKRKKKLENLELLNEIIDRKIFIQQTN